MASKERKCNEEKKTVKKKNNKLSFDRLLNPKLVFSLFCLQVFEKNNIERKKKHCDENV